MAARAYSDGASEHLPVPADEPQHHDGVGGYNDDEEEEGNSSASDDELGRPSIRVVYFPQFILPGFHVCWVRMAAAVTAASQNRREAPRFAEPTRG